MKLTIDTQTDSYEDIKRVLHILMEIIHHKESSFASNYSSDSPKSESAPSDTSNLMSMFNESSSPKNISDTPPDFGSFLNLVQQKENGLNKDRKDRPKIELY